MTSSVAKTASPDTEVSTLERRLVAVVFADVAGFSRLMAENDVDTLRQWRALRREVMEPQLRRLGGRIAEMAGDAVLVEFGSVVHAVQWAVDVQRTVRDAGDGRRGDLHLRIGVNIDDVIDDDGILQGDGVNIAARIHQLAEPGEIVVTAQVHDLVKHRLPLVFRDLGTPPLKNIARAVRVYTVDWTHDTLRVHAGSPHLQWGRRSTLAVLPFRNLSGNPEDSYFGEGITEDIIAGLSRSRFLYVISRNSTLRYAKRDADLRQIAVELDVRYVLDGSVRKHADRLRINAELIDVSANRALWAERFEGREGDLFAFQDHIVASIVGSLEPHVRAVEAARVSERPTESLDAYDCVLKAISLIHLLTQESYRESGELLERAIELDPGYAHAYAYSAWRLNFVLGEGRSDDPARDWALAYEHSQRAVQLDPQDPFALSIAGHLLAFRGQRPAEALELFEQALALDQNSAFAWALSALTCAYLGRPDESRERLRNVWRLSPFDPMNFFFWISAGIGEFVAERYEEAIVWLRKSRRANPRFVATLRMLAASLALAKQEAAAAEVVRDLLAIEPGFRISALLAWYPLVRKADLARLDLGLRAAGLPE